MFTTLNSNGRSVPIAQENQEVEDADRRVYELVRKQFEPPAEVPAANRLQADSRQPAEAVTGALIERLVSSR